MGVATAALGATGIGFTATSAHAEEAPKPSTADVLNQMMNLPFNEFAKRAATVKEAQKNNPGEFVQGTDAHTGLPKVVDKDGIRWDNDGCSIPDSLKPAAKAYFGIDETHPVQDACKRHDLGYRTLQEHHLWSQASKDQIDARYRADLDELYRKGAFQGWTASTQKWALDKGATTATNYLPSQVLGVPVGVAPWDNPTGAVPYTYAGTGAGTGTATGTGVGTGAGTGAGN
ncbi:phospholipase A2 [Streptomyces piniterrae]|nr:phospholipase A2 [Streptomyces piniterrae]